MLADQIHVVLQFCFFIAGLLTVMGVAMKLARQLDRPSGTYGDGLPERRWRTRAVIQDPVVIRPRQVDSQAA